MSDAELAEQLTTDWKYFVVFVSVDMKSLAADSTHAELLAAIQGNACDGETLKSFFHNDHNRRHPQLLDRMVLAITPKVTATDMTASTALFSVCHSLDSAACTVKPFSTAGFVFAAGGRQYVATSLHGQIQKSRQSIPGLGEVILADSFRTDDKTGIRAEEVGFVVCDWVNDFIDVGLIQLLDEHKSVDEWYTEVDIFKEGVKDLRAAMSTSAEHRVRIHAPACFRREREDDELEEEDDEVGDNIAGTIIWAGNNRPDNQRGQKYHFLVQLDRNVVLGQSGSAVTSAFDGRPVGMLVGRLDQQPDIAIVIPLHHIFASLNSVLPDGQKLQLCSCHRCPVTVAASQHATKRVEDASVVCAERDGPFGLQRQHQQNGVHPHSACSPLQGCCLKHTSVANERVITNNPFSNVPVWLPIACAWWGEDRLS